MAVKQFAFLDRHQTGHYGYVFQIDTSQVGRNLSHLSGHQDPWVGNGCHDYAVSMVALVPALKV